MTKAHSELADNGGRCELCNRDDGGIQLTVQLMLGGGLGPGTMWQCERCRASRARGEFPDFDYSFPQKKALTKQALGTLVHLGAMRR